MSRSLEVIEIGNTSLYNRANVVPGTAEENAILALQKDVRMMVKEVKAHTGNKKEFASNEVAKLTARHSFLSIRFDNLEQAIRELAKKNW